MGRYDYQVEVSVHGPWGHFKATSKAQDFYEAVDAVASKLEKQFQKKKGQNQHHHKPELSSVAFLENLNASLEYRVQRKTA
jgi:putative sigma-54 modulation protein